MTELEKILMKAIADVMYDTNHCYVCGHHIAHHTADCAWVAAQQKDAVDGAKAPVHEHDFSNSFYCSVCGDALF